MKYFLCISSSYNLANPSVPPNRQTENLGDFDGFQPSGMPTFQILRFAEIEINPCNSTSNTGTKKAEWRVTIRHQGKKMVDINSRMFFIIIVACGTTGYTIFDSQAQGVLRQIYTDAAKPLISLFYYSTRGICLTTPLLLASYLLRGEKSNLKNISAPKQWMAFAAGAFASLTYVTVLLAMNYVTNVSYVQVFRQLGLIFSLLGGIIILKERCSDPKITGTLLIIAELVITVL